MQRTQLVQYYCDQIVAHVTNKKYKEDSTTHYFRAAKGSGKTTFAMLLGHEMQKRQFEVYFAPYCAAIRESDIQYVHSIMLNRPNSLPIPVFIIDEATIDPKNEIWFYLTKLYKSVIVLAFGVSRAPEDSFLSAATEHYPLELSYANKFYDSEMMSWSISCQSSTRALKEMTCWKCVNGYGPIQVVICFLC